MAKIKIKPIATYRYDYGERFDLKTFNPILEKLKLSPWVLLPFVLLLGLLVYYVSLFVLFLTVILGFVLFFIFSLNKRKIAFYPRFMTLGSLVIYYENITDIDETRLSSGVITIHYLLAGKRQKQSLFRQSFPTDARKDFKIEANTQGKLEKVLARIKKHRTGVDVCLRAYQSKAEKASRQPKINNRQ